MKSADHQSTSAAGTIDQRREPRRPAKGKVTVQLARGQVLAGELVDVSASGFRMAHAESGLEAGQVLEFSHSGAAGQARVIWNRILSGRVETGFLIVERG